MDHSEDATHGQPEFSFYNHHGRHCYRPFTAQARVLRPGQPLDQAGDDPLDVLRRLGILQAEQGGDDIGQTREVGLGVTALFQEKIEQLGLPVAPPS
jgi:hypothetical protein